MKQVINSISQAVKQLVKDRRKSAKVIDYMTVKESSKKLKKKYGF